MTTDEAAGRIAPMNYDEMEAGDELNALVSERVMGNQVFSIGNDETGLQEANSQSRTRNLAPYSTSWEAAGEVVEKMVNKHDTFSLDRQDGGRWHAYFRLAGRGKAPYLDAEGSARADTAPLAIACAALAAADSLKENR
jgi:ABA sandwich protein